MTNKIFSALKVITLAVVLSFGLSYVYAWTAPSTTPPTGNVSAPINTGTSIQQKAGDLTVKGLVADTLTIGTPITSNAITAPKFCLGTSCITAWTQAGAVTKLTAGTNITLSPASGTGNVTVNAVGGIDVYSCPVHESDGPCVSTCTDLSMSSTCTYSTYYSSRAGCSSSRSLTCSYIGKLMP